MHAWHRFARRIEGNEERTSEMIGEKVPMCERKNGRRAKGEREREREREGGGEENKLHERHGFIRARYVTVIRDATWRESTSSRYFWATTPLSLDRQCEFPRFDEGNRRGMVAVAAATVVENHREEKKRKKEMERDTLSLLERGTRGILSHGRISSL